MGKITITWDPKSKAEERMLKGGILDIVATAPEVATPRDEIVVDFQAVEEPEKKELLVEISVKHNDETKISSFGGLAEEVNSFIKGIVESEHIDCVKTQVTAHSNGEYRGISVWESSL